ncbi:SDR family NAD(P)-dependent oxidoreductase (plasmid) [Sphingobium sp. SJ10-10]|uniref:SDR family NAD(P)-dependent oxidoreductase n=1 Tax=unclassified Sphingobium TaxID=2611147 RepID=UPI0007704A2D|nr:MULTISPECIES: SDR family NAD(P)-dependent oxidoreductase [unclassified Sphingobium]AMK26543.1 short-chain dehydrogenase [Sphingobium sp. TKS]MEC6699567.1 SDR family NAD(P)-dependent oxidoreductase [Sphingobium sp. SJ10-10]
MLNEKIAVVTGAAQGLGKAITSQLVEGGAEVICIDRDLAVNDTAASLGPKAHPIVADIANVAQIASLFATIDERWGGVDILCNNAAISGQPKKLHEYSHIEFDMIVDTNLRSTFLFMKHAIPMMLDRGGGSIVNISSIAGLVGNPSASIYSATKSGIIGLTRTAALEYGDVGIRVNAVCPGGILTPLNEQYLAQDASNAQQWIDKHALKRFADADEVARLVIFLASSSGSFITGAAIPVDGGFTAQ